MGETRSVPGMAMISSTESYGARLLRENEAEEESLKDLLTRVRTASIPNSTRTGIQELDTLWRQHGNGGSLAVTGRGFALLYHMVSSMLTTLSGTVVIIDLTSKFSPSHLNCGNEGLIHLHIYFPTNDNLRVTIEGLDNYMLHGEHASKGREWVATILVGNDASTIGKGDNSCVSIGWRGWLKVERDEVNLFGDGIGIEEIWEERNRRQVVVGERKWSATCEEGFMKWM